ncbi:MAG: Hsp20/alpha crystallin family protein [Sphaerochaeta sp.]
MRFYVNDYYNRFNNMNYGSSNWGNLQSKYPALNILEKNDEYIVEVELPGFTIADVNLKLEKHILKISSKNLEPVVEEKKEESSEDKKDDVRFLLKERVQKKFSRSLTLGNDVDEDKLSASLKNGLLLITLPKKEQVLPRAIDVEAV